MGRVVAFVPVIPPIGASVSQNRRLFPIAMAYRYVNDPLAGSDGGPGRNRNRHGSVSNCTDRHVGAVVTEPDVHPPASAGAHYEDNIPGQDSRATTASLSDTKETEMNDKKRVVSKKTDFTGAGTLGDIMSTEEDQDDDRMGLSRAGLVTVEGGTLAARYKVVSPLDRMALTANGNLQRIFSSYYDAPVHVVVDKCELISDRLWDRVVHLTVHNQVS